MTPAELSASQFIKGLLAPMSSASALDPFAIKQLAKTTVRRIAWTAESRLLELAARLFYHHIISRIREVPALHKISERGPVLADTAVTQKQQDLLLCAVQAVRNIEGDIAEIGSFRGVTTVALAAATEKTIYAVDPFIGYGGSATDCEWFQSRVREKTNIKHLRQTSGQAATHFRPSSIAMVFIDGIHDFSNSWFDFVTWSQRVRNEGLIALHDVDDHMGVTLTCSRILGDRRYTLWGYCPNLIIFQKNSEHSSVVADR